MSTITPRKITCPLCETSFGGHTVLSSKSRGPTSSDLRRFTDGEDPIPKQLNACPGCGFTGDVSGFEEHAPTIDQRVPAAATGVYFSQDDWDDAHDPVLADRPAAADSTLREQLVLLADRRAAATDPAVRWENHAQVERWLEHGPLREGDAWLRAAWMHDDAQRDADARRCRRRALHCYVQGISQKKWFARREDLVVIAYLAGELNRRLGNGPDAQRWFEQAIAWSSGMQRLQELVELAERQLVRPQDVV